MIIKKIKEFPRYYVSDTGKIYALVAGVLIDKKLQSEKDNDKVYINLYTNSKAHKRYVHRLVYETFIGKVPKGYVVDHIDRNPLNNNLSNLRKATYQQNRVNSSKSPGAYSEYKGVHYCCRRNRYYASIGYEYKMIRLGSFKTEVEAAKAYNNKCIELYGEFSVLNKV